MSDEEKPIVFPSEDLGIRRLAEPSRALRHGIEYRLDFRRRARDHLQDVAGSRLLLQCLLCLVEQPHVLDRDDRLISEGLEQLDFAFVIGLHMTSRDSDRPNHRVLSSHGHNEGALIWGREHEGIAIRRELCIIRDIVSVNYPAFDDAQAYDMVATRRGGVESPEDAATFRGELDVSNHAHEHAIVPVQNCERTAAELEGVLRDDIKDRLKLGRRTADHTQDLARSGLLLK